jgi:hypothetical protein
MSGAKLTVKVHRAIGHGPHGLFPSEEAYCVVEVPGATPSARQTDAGMRDKSALCWEEEMQFELGSDTKEIRVSLFGQLPHTGRLRAGSRRIDVCQLATWDAAISTSSASPLAAPRQNRAVSIVVAVFTAIACM